MTWLAKTLLAKKATAAIEFHFNPLFPASGPATSSFNGLHPESKFLAIQGDGGDTPGSGG